MVVEYEGYLVDQPDLYSAFVQRELAARSRAITAFGPSRPESATMRASFSAVVFAFQVMNDVAVNGDPTDHVSLQLALSSVARYHLVGGPPVSCANTVADFRSVCGRTVAFATWSSGRFTPAQGLGPDGSIDVTDLLDSLTPRPGG